MRWMACHHSQMDETRFLKRQFDKALVCLATLRLSLLVRVPEAAKFTEFLEVL